MRRDDELVGAEQRHGVIGRDERVDVADVTSAARPCTRSEARQTVRRSSTSRRAGARCDDEHVGAAVACRVDDDALQQVARGGLVGEHEDPAPVVGEMAIETPFVGLQHSACACDAGSRL
jgi:hypothetical protein